MTQLQMLLEISKLGLSVFSTQDIAAVFQVTSSAASQMLNRLKTEGAVMKIKDSLWALPEKIDALTAVKYLAYPEPSYVSMQSALFHHGLISQIPEIVFGATLHAKSLKFETPLGGYSLHHIHPDFFFGFEETGRRAALIATPEKALLDFFYLSASRTGLFSQLPEIEFPRRFSFAKCRQMIKRAPNARLRTVLIQKLDAIAR
jgi:predicted transcriptional regulator of viral defense system